MRLPVILVLFFVLTAAQAQGGAEVDICFNYGCQAQVRIRYSDAQLEAVRQMLAAAEDAGRERAALAVAIGQLYGWAGEQSAIRNDRGGDYADDAVYGRMDCIDHATSTTRLLRLLDARGWLRFHRVDEVARRWRFLIFQHFTAVVEEIRPPIGIVATAAAAIPTALSGGRPAARFAVDSWFYDNGMAAVVLPLDQWLDGAGPDV